MWRFECSFGVVAASAIVGHCECGTPQSWHLTISLVWVSVASSGREKTIVFAWDWQSDIFCLEVLVFFEDFYNLGDGGLGRLFQVLQCEAVVMHLNCK